MGGGAWGLGPGAGQTCLTFLGGALTLPTPLIAAGPALALTGLARHPPQSPAKQAELGSEGALALGHEVTLQALGARRDPETGVSGPQPQAGFLTPGSGCCREAFPSSMAGRFCGQA